MPSAQRDSLFKKLLIAVCLLNVLLQQVSGEVETRWPYTVAWLAIAGSSLVMTEEVRKSMPKRAWYANLFSGIALFALGYAFARVW
jgi:hypothetical protein